MHVLRAIACIALRARFNKFYLPQLIVSIQVDTTIQNIIIITLAQIKIAPSHQIPKKIQLLSVRWTFKKKSLQHRLFPGGHPSKY